jgi:hypothetical protein
MNRKPASPSGARGVPSHTVHTFKHKEPTKAPRIRQEPAPGYGPSGRGPFGKGKSR